VTVLNAPNSTATVDIADEELVKRYEADGWTRVEQPKPKPKK
jgi:hypothetical protein